MIQRRDDAGFSLVEGAVMMVVIAALSGLIVQSIRGLASTQMFTRGQTATLSLAERVVQEIARDLRFSHQMFHESAPDREFLDYLEFDQSAVLAGSRLSVPTANGVFGIDTAGKPTTGNMLFLVTSLPHTTVDVSSGETGDDLLRIGCVQFLVYHLVSRTGGELDLVRWASEPVVKWSDLLVISDPVRRARAAQRLALNGFACAFEAGVAAVKAFRDIDRTTGITTLANPANPPVQRDAEQSLERILTSRHAEIAANGEGGRYKVPQFALATPTFPNGFEVQVDRAGSGSLVLVRVIVAKRRGRDVVNTAEGVRMVALRGR